MSVYLQRLLPSPRAKTSVLPRTENNSIKDNIIGDVRNPFRLKNKATAENEIRDFRTLFESQKEDYFKPVKNGNAFSVNDIE